jgi:integrase/recombinase XerD
LKPTAVTEAFQLRVRLSGLDIPYQGPHCLRHSYATHLLRQGASVKAVGDLLGHRDAESTCVYLRLATEELRAVALPVPQVRRSEAPIIIGPATRRSTAKGTPGNTQANRSARRTSFLLGNIEEYLRLKRSLGRDYAREAAILRGFDAFIGACYPSFQDLNGAMFTAWSVTIEHLSPTVRRNHMRVVRNFCLYRQRSHCDSFVPDPLSFPADHQSLSPHILSESDIARLLDATRYLQPSTRSPLRSENLRVGILLLFTAGLRRRELLRLTLGDFDQELGTLLICATKFHKSRILPLTPSVRAELTAYLALRNARRLPMETASPLIWNQHGSLAGRGYTGTGFAQNWRLLCTALALFTDKGKPPRIHDLRHSFAVNALKHCYINGEDVQSRLPVLWTYMGHVSVASTHYYLSSVEEIRSEASGRFHQRFSRRLLAGIGRGRRGAFERRCEMNPARPNALGVAIKGFFTDYRPKIRGSSPHTVLSYRDSIKLCLRFVAQQKSISVSELEIEDMGVEKIIAFLDHLEENRHNQIGTRNSRLVAVHSFFRYVAGTYHEALDQCQRVLNIPFKRRASRTVEYLEYEEITALISSVDRSTQDGRRDYALFSLMFNTGVRVQELIDLKANDLQLSKPFTVRIFGKGRKERICPIWPETAHLLRQFLEERGIDAREPVSVFKNHAGNPITRFGIRYLLAKHLDNAASICPSTGKKRLHPQSIRHSTAVHLVKSGVDLSTIANWLGHSSVNTTNKYATMDLEMKRQAIEKAKPLTDTTPAQGEWKQNRDLLAWLESL